MIITVSGLPACGKSSVAKRVAKKLGYEHKSTGDIFRRIAKEKEISVRELNEHLEDDPAIDFEIDEKTKLLGKTQDDFVMDSRLAFHFIPHSFKVLLKVSPHEAVRRIEMDENRDHDEKADDEMRKRVASEKKRYLDLYGVDYEDETNFDLVINTDIFGIDEVVKKILEAID